MPFSTSNTSDLFGITASISDERKAQEFLKCDQIDRAIEQYTCIKPESARILMIIGVLFAEKKGDYQSAIVFYERALHIHEKNGDDTSDTYTELGIVYQNLHNYDLALEYHSRALVIRKLNDKLNQKLIANNLIGIASAYWGQQDLSEAFKYAQEAVMLNKSIGSGNEANLATSLVTLANIYHTYGDDHRALELTKQALSSLEYCVPLGSYCLAPYLNNLGTIQFTLGMYADAKESFARALEICEQSFPEGHQQRLTMERNIKYVTQLQLHRQLNFESNLWRFAFKVLLS